MASAYTRLHSLVKAEFGELSVAEERLVKSVVSGIAADCAEGIERPFSLEQISEEDQAFRVRVQVLRWLCLDRSGATLVEAKGVHVRHAYIVGRLDLSYVNLRFPLTLTDCVLHDGVTFTQADLRALSLDGSHCGPIDGTQAVVRGSLTMRDGFIAAGQVRLSGASVHGSLEMSDGRFLNKGGDAIVANGLGVAGSLLMDKTFLAEGSVRLVGATVGKMFVCSGARFVNAGGEALSADGMRVGSSILFDRKFRAWGEVRMLGAQVHGDLSCRGARMLNPRGDALSADGVRVHGSINLNRGFRAIGRVRLIGAEVKRDLTCRDAWLRNHGGDALVADRSAIRGNVYFDGNFACNALVQVRASRVGGDMHFLSCRFHGTGPTGLMAENVQVEGKFSWKGIQLANETTLNLSYASVSQLADDEDSWPRAGRLILNGFGYRAIVEGPSDARRRLVWVQRQPSKPFYTQPYDQLASVLQRAGYDGEATQVAIAREDAKLKYGDLSVLSMLQQAFLKYFGDYGYRPHHRAMKWAIFFVVIGTFVFYFGFEAHQFSPTRERVYLDDMYVVQGLLPEDYPAFNPLVYSIDALVPFLELHQEEYWLPNANRRCGIGDTRLPCGSMLRIYLWLHIVMGWVVTTLFAIGFSGVVKKS